MNENAPASGGYRPLERGITVQEAAVILGYSDVTIRRMVRRGELESYGRGKKLRIYESAIERYRRNNTYNFETMPTVRQMVRKTGARHQAAIRELGQLLG